EPQLLGYKNTSGDWVSLDQVDASGDAPLHRATGEALGVVKLAEGDVLKKSGQWVLASDPSVRVQSAAFKMSKSRGNVVNPEDVVAEFGADSLRVYEMFMGP